MESLAPIIVSTVGHSCVCQSATLIDFDSSRFSSIFSLYLSFDRARNRIEQKDLLVQRLTTLIAKNWVDGSGVDLITQHTHEAVDSMKRIIMDDRVSGIQNMLSVISRRMCMAELPCRFSQQTHTRNDHMSSDHLHCFPDPLPLEQMFYDRAKNPEKPDWIAVRGSSRIDGGHKYYHASVPGTSYSVDLGGTILACRLGDASIRASAKNEGKPAVNLDDAFAQELKKQVCNPDWKYSLPNGADVADCTDELFGTEYEAGSHTLEEAITAMHSAGVEVAALADEEERDFPGIYCRSCSV